MSDEPTPARKTYWVSSIVWDTDGRAVRLPTETWVECADEELIAEALSERYGWLVSDFVAREVQP